MDIDTQWRENVASTYLYAILCCGRWVGIYSDMESLCPTCRSTFTTTTEV